MDYTKILYLVNILKNDSSGRESQLKDIYDKAVKDSDSYKELINMNDSFSFFDNGSGRLIKDESERLLGDIFADPSNGVTTLLKMRSVIDRINYEVNNSVKILESPEVSSKDVTVLKCSTTADYSKMLDIIASAAIYIFVILGELKNFNSIRWNINNSINAKLRILGSDMLEPLANCERQLYFWKIIKQIDKSEFKFADYRYVLKYITFDEYLKSTSSNNRVSDNLYTGNNEVTNTAYETVYIGMGNIVSCSAEKCIDQLIGKGFVTDSNIRMITNRDIEIIKNESIQNILSILSEGNNYSISPEKAVYYLNEYVNAKVIADRRKNGKCLFCGKPISSGTVCQKHFKIERLPI